MVKLIRRQQQICDTKNMIYKLFFADRFSNDHRFLANTTTFLYFFDLPCRLNIVV